MSLFRTESISCGSKQACTAGQPSSSFSSSSRSSSSSERPVSTNNSCIISAVCQGHSCSTYEAIYLKIVVDEKGAKRKNTRETYYDVKQRHNMAEINNTLTTIQFKKYIYLKKKEYWVHNLYINSSQTKCILI